MLALLQQFPIVHVFSGTGDHTVTQAVVDKTAAFYCLAGLPESAIRYIYNETDREAVRHCGRPIVAKAERSPAARAKQACAGQAIGGQIVRLGNPDLVDAAIVGTFGGDSIGPGSANRGLHSSPSSDFDSLTGVNCPREHL